MTEKREYQIPQEWGLDRVAEEIALKNREIDEQYAAMDRFAKESPAMVDRNSFSYQVKFVTLRRMQRECAKLMQRYHWLKHGESLSYADALVQKAKEILAQYKEETDG